MSMMLSEHHIELIAQWLGYNLK